MSNISVFTNVNYQYNRYVPPTVFFFGVIGDVFNVIIFLRPVLRKNPCTTYFFGLAIASLINLTFGLPVDYLSVVYGINLLTDTIVFCRFRFMIVHSALVLSSWFIVLASIDRFCISSRDANRRRFSTMINARRLVIVSTLICFTMYAHILACFTIESTASGPVCYARSGTYRVFYDLFFLITFALAPLLLMVIVGLATFYNITQGRGQIRPVVSGEARAVPNNISQLRKRERQFVKMLLLQLTVTVALTLPITVQKLYATFTQNLAKNADRLQIESFAAQVVRTLTHINSGLSFYLYTLSSSVFRREFGVVLCKAIGVIFGVNSRYYQRCQRINEPTPRAFSITAEGTRVTKRQATIRA